METAVYGADINDEDIAVMTATGSPWKATAGGDPHAIGASLISIVSLSAANELTETQIKIPSTLITQEFLLENDVANLEGLDSAMPELTLPYFMQACWIRPIDIGSTINEPSASVVPTLESSSLMLLLALASWLV
jgi:simple sugar transport system substrate-binding protein